MKNIVLLGTAGVDITPAANVQTVGYSGLSQGVLHRLQAQITVWHSAEGLCCLAAIDHIGFMSGDAKLLREDIARKLGTTRDKVMLCFSHTHSAPNISLEPEYFTFLREQVLKGVDQAQKTPAPVKAVWGIANAAIGVNRRNPSGPLDRRLGILKIADAGTGKLKLLLLRVTAHANALHSPMISSDFIGVTRKLLEEKYGCMVMITQGASGNVNPKYSGSPEALDKMAYAIMEAIDPYVHDLEPDWIHRLSMVSRTESFFANVPAMECAREISEEAMLENGIDGSNWLEEVARLNREGIKTQSSESEIQYFSLNDGCLCGVADEIMCELAIAAVDICGDDLFFFGGYTNGCGGYLPGAAEYDRGGFEVLHSYLIFYPYHGRVMPLNRDTADKLVEIAAGLWKEIK